MRPITASDLMNPSVLLARADWSLEGLATFLMENEITGAPVEDEKGRLVGVVSVVDIVRTTAAADGRRSAEALAERVGEIMTPLVFTVAEDATVSEIASIMVDQHLHRLLVTREGKPVGIISTSDLLGLLIDEDED